MKQKLDIRKWTRPASFQKGQRIYEEGKVLSWDVVEEENGVDSISANVKGSGRNIYLSEVELDTRENMIRDYYCECPAYDAYPSLCKHCVALLLKYQEMRQAETPVPAEGSKEEDGTESGESNTGEMKTTPALKQLLQNRMRTRALPVLQGDIHGKVHLLPRLENQYGMHLEFKIGAEKMYIVKNVLGLAEHVEKQMEYSYGKNLSFVHTRDAFDEESKPLLDFILQWVHKYRNRNTKRYYTSYYYIGAASIRKMDLEAEDLEDFLTAQGDRPFAYEGHGSGTGMYHVTSGELPRRMTVRGTPDGIEIKVSRHTGQKGRNHYIYFEDGNVYLESLDKLSKVEDFIDFIEGETSDTVYINREDAPSFCRELLPALEDVYICEKETFDIGDYGVVAASYEFYLDAPNRNLVLCRAEAVYGEKRFSVFDSTPSGVRDLAGEAAVKNLVSQYGNAFDNREQSMALAGDDDLLYALLTNGIRAFRQVGKVFVSDAIKRIEIRESPHVTLGVSLSGDMLQLDFSSGEMSREELIEILSKYQKKKKYYRLKNGDFVRMDGEGIEVLQEIREDLNLTVKKLKENSITVPKYRALYLDVRSHENRGRAFAFERDRGFRALVRSMGDMEENEYAVPDALEGILRPYQRDGFRWLKTLCRNGFGGILADDMGLGKTLQVIAFLLSEFEQAGEGDNRRTLVVAPASLVFNWRNEIARFAPELPVCTVTGRASERQRIIRESGEREILLTSYDLIRRDMEAYEGIPFFCQVIDEAQYIKNHNTKAAHAVKKISASFHVALTGTPVENRLSELWSIFDYLMPGFLYAYKRFREEIEVPVVQNGQKQALERLQRMIGPFVLRRLKREVLKDLPDKLEENVYAPLAGEQGKLYDAHVQRMKLMLGKKTDEEFRTSKIEILSELTRLRQLCCNPGLVYENYRGNAEKLEVCLELVENAVQGGHKILLFSQFTSMLQILQERLDERGVTFYTLTGSTGKEKRLQLVEQFNTDDTSVFCISLKAGGTGLNLTAADVVIHYDPWWNLAVQNQATDRAHRIGQKHVVTVYKLVMKDTIEEAILNLQEKKRELAEQVLDGEEIGRADFTREELLMLLGEQ